MTVSRSIHCSPEWTRRTQSMSTSGDDSFNTGKQSPVAQAFFDGLVDGNKAADPALSHVEELVRERSDGGLEVVHRYWYRAE